MVVADGANSRFGRALGTSRDRSYPQGMAIRGYYASPMADDPWIESALDVRDREGRSLPGYGWVFPLGDGTVNVGIGLLSTFKGWREVNTSRLMDEWAATAPAEWGFSPEAKLSEPTGGRLPMAGSVGPKAGPSWLVVGDVAVLTRDGGTTWELEPTSADLRLTRGWWLTKKVALYAGTDGEDADAEQLFVTADGFANTEPVDLPLPVSRFAFQSPARGWALSEGTVHAVTPPRKLSGAGWKFQPLGPLASASEGQEGSRLRTFDVLLDLHFTSARQGFAVGSPSLLLGTRDGGKTWAPPQVTAP